MDRFPLDLLRSVIQSIPKRDLPHVRLVCRSFDKTAVEYIFCDVTVWIQRQSLERLLNISRSDRIQKYVRHLTLSFELLQKDLPDPHRYLGWLYQQQSGQQNPSHRMAVPPHSLTFANIGAFTRRDDWTAERVSNAYAAYKMRVEEQKSMELLGMDTIALTTAFSLLKHLRSITIKSDYYGQASIETTELPRDIAVLQRETLLSPFYTQQTRLRDTGRLHLSNIIRAASFTGAKITNLTILDSENTMTPRILALCPDDLHIAITAFQNVKRFYFKLPDYNINEEDVEMFEAGQLALLVQAMPALEELTLVSSSYSPYVSWTTVCGMGRLMFLRVLDLQCFDFHESELVEFLIRHKSTLRMVNFFCVEMYSGTFKSLLHTMRQNLSLTSLGLSGVLEDTNGNFLDYSYAAAKALEDFVTLRTEEFPTSLLLGHQCGNSVDEF